MILKSLLTAACAVAIAATCAIVSTAPARAQDVQAELLGLHQLCDHGDRRACVRFGMILGRVHPEWFWWER